MSQQDKPREFWVKHSQSGDYTVHREKPEPTILTISIFSVVEKYYTEKLEAALKEAVEALEDIAFRVSVSGEDKDGGPCRFSIGDDRNQRIMTAKYAINRIRKVMG